MRRRVGFLGVGLVCNCIALGHVHQAAAEPVADAQPARAVLPAAAPGPTAATPSEAPPETHAAVAAATSQSPSAPAGATRLSARGASERGRATSHDAQAREAALRGAEARVAQAWSAFLPRLTTTAQYARLSDFTAPSLPGRMVATPAPNGTLNPAPTQAVTLAFPTVVDTVLLQATLGVPLSDYFLRINKGYSAASRSLDAARYDIEAAQTRAAGDAQTAYYTWLRARANLAAAETAHATAKVHQEDAGSLFATGNLPRAEVLRASAAVSATEYAVVSAKSFVEVAEVQLRVVIGATDAEVIVAAESLDTPVAPLRDELPLLVQQAHSSRAELKSLDASAAVLRDRADATRAEQWPALGAFGDVTVGHPNMRRFPLEPEWFPTWAAGVRLTWTPTDLPGVYGRHDEVKATLATLDAQRNALRDAIRVEVTTQWYAAQVADQAISAAQSELESATASYEAALDRYRNGSGTSTLLLDAEGELTRVRLSISNAQAEARIARVRLAQAVGRTYTGSP
jgi:outer membrane protein